MYGGEAYNQNTSAAGVTYNCGGESRNLHDPSSKKHRTPLPNLSLLSFLVYCADCGSEVVLRPGDIVICRECGYRILYKKRTKQSKSSTWDNNVFRDSVNSRKFIDKTANYSSLFSLRSRAI